MAEFQRSLQRFFLALNQLMQSPLEGPTLLSQVGPGLLLGRAQLCCVVGGRAPRPGTGCPQAEVTLSILCADLPRCQKELPPCLAVPRVPPLGTLRPQTPSLPWGWDVELGQQLGDTGQVLSCPPGVLKCAKENLGRVPGDCPPSWISAWPHSLHPGPGRGG